MLGELPIALRSRNDVRPWLLGLAAMRAALAVVAIPLAPLLWDDHLALLVLLRPTKEVFLLAGYEVLEGRLSLPVVVCAAMPLLVLGVWIFYFLGRAYADEIEDADLPGVAGRLLPPKRIKKLRNTLADRGWPLVLLGRIASMPSTLVAAAAGSADVPVRTFLLADLAGACASTTAMLLAGYALGEAYHDAGPWFTAAGAIALLTLLTILGKRLSGEGRTRGASRRTRP
jgi:membrane protein DedA with SNARE-associated domain